MTTLSRTYARPAHRRGWHATLGAVAAAALAACGGAGETPTAVSEAAATATVDDAADKRGGHAGGHHRPEGRCDAESIAKAFRGGRKDERTTVLLTKAFAKGDALTLATPSASTPVAGSNLCFVKLLVGPGNPGTAGAPSTSAGIGLEVWLPAPADWNERIRNLGGGGWAGGLHTSTTSFGNVQAAGVAAGGYVVGTTDTGHTIGSGSFAMREDGTINTTLWSDFAERSLLELARKTKALTKSYYGQKQRYAYWEGCSTGGRQGYKMAQEHADEYDGYLNEMPAFNWSRFITNELYPQVVMQRDLGAPIAPAKLAAVSAAATSACDRVNGQSLGYILDPRECRYDPTRDAAALCSGAAGNGGVIGTNANAAACVNLAEAHAVNKIW